MSVQYQREIDAPSDPDESYPSKQGTTTQCCFNVGPASKTLVCCGTHFYTTKVDYLNPEVILYNNINRKGDEYLRESLMREIDIGWC